MINPRLSFEQEFNLIGRRDRVIITFEKLNIRLHDVRPETDGSRKDITQFSMVCIYVDEITTK